MTTTRPCWIRQYLLITVIQLQLGCHGGDIPDSQILHKVTTRMPVYMPMPIIDQHLHMKTQNNAVHHAIAHRESMSLAWHQDIETQELCHCQ